ncbi:phage head closure protein [Clostridium beijerinckii]|uniref:SPP1 family predicted phage head-tail adaptor n=1 Tax=Clostridium beijerinckii TaxID=1520 RepID=A0AAX0B019_CLOBE|nr:phage head closure protein [Clostridium beijerinckii]NRT88531.1 SPP1 family predicted phage head-tail adaptor [Clostridium beijerinckii]NYC73986.1 SPP1 family predicted phage head-tail adaptor [Clostridium beijerinckii]
MNSSDLKERIIISKYLGEVQNENGFDEPTWDDTYYTCWSSFKQISGKEFISAKANNSENIVTFTVRYSNKTKVLLEVGATKKYKVIYKEKDYDIIFCSDYNNLHQWIDIKAEVKG